MKKSLGLLFVSVLLALASCNGGASNESVASEWQPVDWNNPQYGESVLTEGATLDVYGLNDTHGSCEYLPDNYEPGINRLATYILDQEETNPYGNVLIASGDMFQGSLDSNIEYGSIMIDWMKYMKVDAMTLGNHEFDWGVQKLEENVTKLEKTENGEWGIPFLACNVYKDNKQVIGTTSTAFIKNGFKVGIIGSIASSVRTSIDSTIVEGYDFKTPTKMVIDEAERLRSYGANIIIYATHGGENTVQSKIADYVDLVLLGHDHQYQNLALSGNSKTIPMLEAGCNGRYLDHAEFKYANGEIKYASSDVYGPVISATPDEDPGSKAIYDRYLAKSYVDGTISGTLLELKTNVIGSVTSSGGETYISQTGVCSLFVSEQLKQYTTSDSVIASFYNAARASWVTGNKTYEDVYKAFPFDNTTLILTATGEQLQNWSSVPSAFADGYSFANLVRSTTYQIVTCTFVINNLSVPYSSISKEYAGVYQRHVMYNAFQDADNHELFVA